MNERIGTREKWPVVDITGQPYDRPATTAMLDDEHFVVLPVNFANWPLVESLKAELKPKRQRKVDNDDES